MVKGVSRRVVIVRPKSGASFEQAIFIVRDEGGGSDALREACTVAESYIEHTLQRLPKKRYTRLHLFGAWCTGALLPVAAWLVLRLLP